MKKLSETILIICEGTNTEPQFFNSLRDEIINQTYQIGDVAITIKPEPLIIKEEEVQSEYKPKRAVRQLKKPLTERERAEITGIPPLKWVLAGQDELNSGAYSEVWVVFDNDNHPARKEAFERANEEINGSKVNIAFSSISFEYYLLLNFEKIYKAFPNTQCKTEGKNRKSINCGTGENPDDCKGAKCINGYAFLKGYWKESKGQISLYPLVKDKLKEGFENSVWLRIKSDKIEPHVPVYERNPYVTSDYLVKRLTGYNYESISNGASYQFKQVKVSLIGDNFQITNTSEISVIIPLNSFCFIQESKKREHFGERIILKPAESAIVLLDLHIKKENYNYTFTLDSNALVFEI